MSRIVARNNLVESTPLRELSTLFARAYLRLLAQRGDAHRALPAGREPLISVDSLCSKSVNWVDKDGERDA